MENNHAEVLEFLEKLHGENQFEIFCAKETKNKNPEQLPSSVGDIDWLGLEKINNQDYQFGVWFTPNSMQDGKRLKSNLTSINSVTLDKDFKDVKNITFEKKKYIEGIHQLQLGPTAIVETKNGLHLYWFIENGSKNKIKDFESVQKSMQEKLETDRQSTGAEHLFRLPDFNHWKDPSDPFHCKLIFKNYDRIYKLHDLGKKYGRKRKYLSSLKKKTAPGSFSGKPIEIENFVGQGSIDNIAKGCEVFRRLENESNPGHLERFLLAATYLNLGKEGLQHFKEISKDWIDYNRNFTEYQ
ncbi:MAG: hypothetical protein K9N00_04220, partial [Candidatus Marinimicrobia bacterium]|nr:hypothetical protein [Candidatus Neomarinimicrobiota bacterium]